MTRNSKGQFLASNGLFQTADVDVPRFSHDAVTGAAKGLLCEPSASNSIVHSNNISASAWSRSSFSATGAFQTAPDGFDRDIWSFGNGYCYQDFSTVQGEIYTSSVWVKANTACSIGLRNLSANDSSYNVPINITTTWQRFEITGVAQGTTSRFLLDNRPNFGFGTGGLEVSVWNAQIEKGDEATSPIATDATIVTRAQDTAGLYGMNGQYDIRLTYGSGQQETLLAQTLTDGYWPNLSQSILSRLEVYPAGSL